MGKHLSCSTYRSELGAPLLFEHRAPLELRQCASSQAGVARSNQQFYGPQAALQGLQWPTAILSQASQRRLPHLNMGVMCALSILQF